MNDVSISRFNSLQVTAELFNVHRNTIKNWISEGAPVVEHADRARGIPWLLDTAALQDWLIRRAVRAATSRR
jgi:phage terminase Nu1 subunit (DNA packaging protein)